MSPDSPLSAARRAVCNAIDHWAPLADTFKRKLYMERAESGFKLAPTDFRDLPSAQIDLPCIRIRPAMGTHPWDTNQSMTIGYTSEITLWFPWEQVDAAELTWIECIRAIHQSKEPGDTDTYIGRVKAKQVIIEPMRIGYPKIGEADRGIKAIQLTFGVTIPVRIQPQQNQFT